MLLRILVLVASFAVLSEAVLAKEKRLWEFNAGGWSGGAYQGDDGRFSHCAISGVYETNITLALGVTGDYEVQIVLGKNEWKLPIGSSYDIPISVDGRSLGVFQALVTTPRFLLLNVGENSQVFRSLQRGRVLIVEAARESFRFNLDGTALALAEVLNCVDTAIAAETGSTNPFDARGHGGGSSNPFGDVGNRNSSNGSASNPGRNEQTIVENERYLIEGLLSLAGLEDIQFVDPATSSFVDAGYAWLSDDLEGAVYVRRGQEIDIDRVGSVVMATLAEKCPGDFASKAPPVEVFEQRKLKQFSAACNSTNGAGHYYYAATALDYGDSVTVFVNTTSTAPQELQTFNQSLAAWFRGVFSD